jgi:adenylyltransferase/sulfurtransferase
LTDIDMQRYHRQTLLPQIGEPGQRRLAAARVLLVGCGALGTAVADQLVRAGVGHLTLVDRDIVELTNLQRQTLFDERDAADETPKAVAAATRLRAANSSVEIIPRVTDVHAGNVEDLAGLRPQDSALRTDLIIDGTDNVQTRYLLNDVSVKHAIPWVYGAAVSTEGRVMTIVPGATPCLRCIFPTPPSPQDLPTCDTAGVLGMGTAIVGAYEAIEALKLLIGHPTERYLLRFDFWSPRTHVVSLADAKRPDCPTCGLHQFDYLESRSADAAAALCGRNAIQVRPPRPTELSLISLAARLAPAGDVRRTPHFVKIALRDPAGVTLTVFPDGRSLSHGVTDLGRAKSLHARFVGS